MSEQDGANTSDSNILNDEKTSPSLNDIMYQDNNFKELNQMGKDINIENQNSERETLSHINKKPGETDALSLGLNIIPKKQQKEESKVLNIPPILNKTNTLNETIMTTIIRDLYLIYTKIIFVVIPFYSKEQKKYHIRQWDLWGPLILNLLLSFTLSFNTKGKGQITTLLFVIFWFGGTLLYLNAKFLGVNSSIFQIFCLLGYNLFPLNLAAIIVTILKINDFLRLIIVLFFLIWATYSSGDYLKAITNPEQRYLVLYPCILFYLYISWFIFSTKI